MQMRLIDLRSDTVTRPSSAMRTAMVAAEVGDDGYGEDPTVRALEERAALLFGKAAALFVPSGRMANQVALLVHAGRGDEVLYPQGAHLAMYEAAAGAAFAQAQMTPLGRDGLFSAEDVVDAIQPHAIHSPRTSLIWIENTHNRAGGRIFPIDEIERIAAKARERAVPLHIDGARLLNASVATGVAPTRYGASCASLSFCLSKGLGAPVGSVVVGSREVIDRARRARLMLGGTMRQAGILAAAGLYALEKNIARLADDHANARLFADLVAGAFDVSAPETNIVMLGVRSDAVTLVERAKAIGLLLNAVDRHRVRAVTHLDVGAADIRQAAEILKSIST